MIESHIQRFCVYWIYPFMNIFIHPVLIISCVSLWDRHQGRWWKRWFSYFLFRKFNMYWGIYIFTDQNNMLSKSFKVIILTMEQSYICHGDYFTPITEYPSSFWNTWRTCQMCFLIHADANNSTLFLAQIILQIFPYKCAIYEFTTSQNLVLEAC